MNRELLEKAKMLEKRISELEIIENLEKEELQFSVRKNYDFLLPSYITLPKEMNHEIMNIVRRYKMSYERQLEAL